MRTRTEFEERFEIVYQECKDDINLVCLHYVKDPLIANEIMQRTFLKVYERYRSEQPEKLKAYLANAAKNMCLNYIRDTKREVQSDEIEIYTLQSMDLVESPEDTYIQKETRRERSEFCATIIRELEVKNPSWYAIIYMLYVLEMDYDEIAEKIGETKEVVYARLHRAKTWIRKKYGDVIEDILT